MIYRSPGRGLGDRCRSGRALVRPPATSATPIAWPRLPRRRRRDRPVPGRPQGPPRAKSSSPSQAQGGARLTSSPPRTPRPTRRSGSRNKPPLAGGGRPAAPKYDPVPPGNVLPHVFQRHASEGLDATYHFTFTGEESADATVVIRDKTDPASSKRGHVGTPGPAGHRPTAAPGSGSWPRRRSLVWARLLRRNDPTERIAATADRLRQSASRPSRNCPSPPV